MLKNDNAKIKVENKIALKSGFWYTASNFFTRSVVFLTTPVFARLLTTDEFGNFHVYANWQSIFLIICGMQFAQTINRARLDYDKQELKNYIGNILIFMEIVTFIIFILIITNNKICYGLLLLDKKYIVLMFSYLFFYPAFEIFQAEQRVKYNYRLSSALSFLSVFLGAVLALVGAYLCSDRLFGRIIGQYIPAILLGVYFLIFYFFNIKKINFVYCRYALNIAAPLIISYLGSQILSSSDKIVVQHMSSSEAVAFIGIVTSISHIMTILIQSINNAWAPWLYDKFEKKEYENIHSAFGIYLLLIAVCTFGVALLGPELLLILGGNKYTEAIWLIPPSISYCIFNLMIFQYVNIETYYKETQFAAIATGITAILNIVLDMLFVHIFGYIAASFVTVVCYAMLMFLHAGYLKRMDSNKLVQNKHLMQAVIYVAVIISVSYLVYINRYLRYLFFMGLICLSACVLFNILKGQGRKNE